MAFEKGKFEESLSPILRDNIDIVRSGTKKRSNADADILLVENGFEVELGEALGRHLLPRKDLWLPEHDQPSIRQLLKENIINKRVLLMPGYGRQSFLFKRLGASEVVSVDADIHSLAWLEAIRSYFNTKVKIKMRRHKKEGMIALGEYLMASFELDTEEKREESMRYKRNSELWEKMYETNFLLKWILSLKLRFSRFDILAYRTESYMCPGQIREQVMRLIEEEAIPDPLEGINYTQANLGAGELEAIFGKNAFSFVHIPFILGVSNGIKDEEGVKRALNDIFEVAEDGAAILIAPYDDEAGEDHWWDAEYGMRTAIPSAFFSKLHKIMTEDPRFELMDVANFSKTADITEILGGIFRVKKQAG